MGFKISYYFQIKQHCLDIFRPSFKRVKFKCLAFVNQIDVSLFLACYVDVLMLRITKKRGQRFHFFNNVKILISTMRVRNIMGVQTSECCRWYEWTILQDFYFSSIQISAASSY